MRRTPGDASGIFDGVLNVLKPPGMTSHDVVDVLRRLAGMRRIGHTGTLDPGASGVLVLCLGHATSIAEFLTEKDKAYRAEFTLGVAIDSGDAYGTVVSDRDGSGLDRSGVEDALAGFVGTFEQLPPMVSAVRRGGKRLYELARRGQSIEVQPRRVEVTECRLLDFAPGSRPRALVHIECSKGTYVRAIARDLGERLGCGAHASFVLRTRAGRFRLDESLTLEEIAEAAEDDSLATLLVSPDEALSDLPAVALTPMQRQQVMDGRALPLFQVAGWRHLPPATPIRLRDSRGLVALGRVAMGQLRPFRVVRPRGAS